MPTMIGFTTFASIPEERISDKIVRRIVAGENGMIVWWSIGAGVHVETHHHPHEQIVWMLKGKMDFQDNGPGTKVVLTAPLAAASEGYAGRDGIKPAPP